MFLESVNIIISALPLIEPLIESLIERLFDFCDGSQKKIG